jgi:hypothetical protein
MILSPRFLLPSSGTSLCVTERNERRSGTMLSSVHDALARPGTTSWPQMNKRPLTVTIIGWLLVAVGIGASAFHLNELKQNALRGANAWIFLVELVIIISGVFVLRGQNWARWLAVAWIGAHVVISFLNSWGKGSIHVLILFLLTCFLFRPESNAYFRKQQPKDV